MIIKTIKRNTRLKNVHCYIQKMLSVGKTLGLIIEVYIVDSQNMIFHVNVDLEAIVQGEQSAIDTFDELIEKM